MMSTNAILDLIAPRKCSWNWSSSSAIGSIILSRFIREASVDVGMDFRTLPRSHCRDPDAHLIECEHRQGEHRHRDRVGRRGDHGGDDENKDNCVAPVMAHEGRGEEAEPCEEIRSHGHLENPPGEQYQ